MTDPLFDLFVTFKYVKIIWKILEVKYRADDTEKRNKWLVDGSGFKSLMINNYEAGSCLQESMC